jgi:hypothetical protein
VCAREVPGRKDFDIDNEIIIIIVVIIIIITAS